MLFLSVQILKECLRADIVTLTKGLAFFLSKAVWKGPERGCGGAHRYGRIWIASRSSQEAWSMLSGRLKTSAGVCDGVCVHSRTHCSCYHISVLLILLMNEGFVFIYFFKGLDDDGCRHSWVL